MLTNLNNWDYSQSELDEVTEDIYNLKNGDKNDTRC